MAAGHDTGALGMCGKILIRSVDTLAQKHARLTVQPIGEKPDPTKTVNAQSQAPFGTGAWLLAACEMLNYIVDTSLMGRIAG